MYFFIMPRKAKESCINTRFFNLFIPFSIILLPLLCLQPVRADDTPNKISLAISGGASMGAYEAGLIWGLVEALRQMENTEEDSLGGERRPIALTSIAGTSAGGINTLLAALAWSVNPEDEGGFTNRIDDNIFRDVWLTPDVNRLLPPDADSPQYSADDALLSRKDLIEVARDVSKKWHRPGSFRPGLRLPLGFTVTRVRPETMFVSGVKVYNQRFYIPFELQTQADGSVKFFFDPHDYPSLVDPAMILMPWPADAAPFSISDQQVEDALMTTSAFPGGFGRKRLKYCRKKAFPTADAQVASPALDSGDGQDSELICPDGYELTEAEFADGGLFDNLPIGLARALAESSRLQKEMPLPVKYVYLDPERERYKAPVLGDNRACAGQNPPDACRQLTYNLAAEAEVLGGAIGTARKYELYRELTSDNWRLNLSQLSRKLADIIDADQIDVPCDAVLPYFDRNMPCSDRLRFAARLLELTHSYRITPIIPPLSAQALLDEGIATTCAPPSEDADPDVVSQCDVDAPRLRNQLATVLADLAPEVIPQKENLRKDIWRSARSIDSDRSIHVTTRGNPITGLLLGSFGAFFEYKFREFDYYVGVYDAVMVITNNQCTGNYPLRDQQAQRSTCRDRLSEHLYRLLGVADNPKSSYVFALMAKQEFGSQGGLSYAYDPMPPEDRDMRIISEGLNRSFLAAGKSAGTSTGPLSTEREFFTYLKAEGFEPTPPPGGGKSLLTSIINDPDFWSHELINRSTSRLVYLERGAQAIYQAREPDPEKQEKAKTTMMGAGALALRTATYQYPPFTFSPSTAPEDWFWRNIIPYETAFDVVEGDILFVWQPTWNFKQVNAGIRLGLGFAGGLFKSSAEDDRENYGTLGLDLTRIETGGFFSGWGVTPAVYHDWNNPKNGNQTSFGFDVHANLFKNRVRISVGTRDVINDADDAFFITIGFADLPGLIYWMSR